MKKYSEKCEISNLQFWDIATQRHVTQTPGGRRVNLKLPETAFHGPLSHRRSRPPASGCNMTTTGTWQTVHWFGRECIGGLPTTVLYKILLALRLCTWNQKEKDPFLRTLQKYSRSSFWLQTKPILRFRDFAFFRFFFIYMMRSGYEVRQPAP